jgi:hypothetical protein
MAKSDGVAKTGKITRRGLHESLAAYKAAKEAKKAARVEKNIERTRRKA